MEQTKLFFETFFIFCLFLITDIHAYGYKKRHLPTWASVILYSLILTSINTLFYNNTYQYAIFVGLLIVAGMLYTFVFIDAHVFYSASLQLEIITCYLVLKAFWTILIYTLFPDSEYAWYTSILFYVSLLISMIACSLFFSDHTLKAPFEHPCKYYIVITLIPLMLLVFTTIFPYSASTYSLTNMFMNLLIVALLITTHYLSYLHISSYNELIEAREISQHMEFLQSHIERSSALVEQIRRDKHEMKNVYFYLNSLVESKEYDELSEFVSKKLLHRYDRLEEFHTGCKVLDYLLSQKVCEAMDAGISVIADVTLPEELRIEKNDLCSVLQNLLDNAIDASQKEQEKDIHLKICQQKNYLAITVKNRTSKDILKTNPKLLTTKSNKKIHGIGTKVIRKIVEKNDGVIDYSMESGYFVVHILLVN